MQYATKPVFLALITADAFTLGVLAWLAWSAPETEKFASWLNGQGGRVLMPLLCAKFMLMAAILAYHRHMSAAAGWAWLAIAKASGLHLAAGLSLSVHVAPLAFELGAPSALIGKLLAMAAVGLIAAGLFALGWSNSPRKREQAQLGLSGILAFATVSALPELLAQYLPAGLAAWAIVTELLGETVVTSTIFWLVLAMTPPAAETTERRISSQLRQAGRTL